MLSQIRPSNKAEYDIKIFTEKNKLSINISDKLKSNVVKNVNVDNFSFKGEERMAIYITSLNDPHFLYDSIELSLKDLFKADKLEFTLNVDSTNKSIYTRKLFDKYIRVT